MDKEHFDVGLVSFGHANNIGGILTSFALFRTLEDNGYKTLVIDKPDFWWPDFTHDMHIMSDNFRKKYVRLSKIYKDKKEIKELNNLCDTFVVGSDQMWHYYLYASAGHFTFLDFANKRKKKISYATSFGHDKLFCDETEIEKIKDDLKTFDAVSVREESGVDICREKFGVQANCNLDPVFLCRKAVFNKLAASSKEKLPKEDFIFSYVLDLEDEKKKVLNKVSLDLKLKNVIATDAGILEKDLKNINWNLTKINSVEQWLKYVKNCKFMITDSFHGCCFAIIFNKPFICLQNENRGSTRFDSLLSKLDLKSRMLTKKNKPLSLRELYQEIDYIEINKKLKKMKKSSLKWLLDALNTYKEVEDNNIFYRNINEMDHYFGETTTVQEIVDNMPENSSLIQVQGELGKPVLDTPVPFGVLTIHKTTNYFVDITFKQMTIDGKDPNLFIGRWVKEKLIGWTRFVSQNEIESLEKRLEKLEKEIQEKV